jgi:hypothetical protein
MRQGRSHEETACCSAVSVLTSPEGRQNETQALFRHLLRRDADLSGMGYFSIALMGGTSDQQMEAQMAGSGEYGQHI